MTSQETQRMLLEAADMIERHGWCRYFYKSHGRYCMFGALYAVTDGRPVPRIALRALREAIGPAAKGGNFATWNDDQRTRRPVLAALRGAADLLKSASRG